VVEIKEDTESDDDEELKPIVEKGKKNEQYRKISTYNGGENDKYSWSQDI
jgi:hypothetical protein